MPQPTRVLLPLVVVAAFAVAFLEETAVNVVDFDTWHQMASARDVLSGRVSLDSDPYSFTDTIRPIVHHEWGTGLIAYRLAASFGPNSLLALKYLILACPVLIGFATARATAGSWLDWALIVIPVVPLISVGFMPALRAQMFTYLFVAILIAVLQVDEAGKRWWIPVWLLAFPIWVNLHGGCAVAIVLMIAAAGERIVRNAPFAHLLFVSAAMAALLMVNPFGSAYYEFLWRTLRNARPYLLEWQPLWKSLHVFPMFLVCVLTLLIGISQTGWRKVPGIAILLVTGFMALNAIKLAPLFGIAWLSYGPAIVSGTRLRRDIERQNRDAPHRPLLCWLVLLVIFAVSGGARQWQVRVPGQPLSALGVPPYPVGTVNYLADQKFRGNILAPFEFGAYVTWKLSSAAKIFLDSRYEEVYPEHLFAEEVRFYTAGPGWREILSLYPIDVVIVPNATAAAAVMPGSGWPLVYVDPQYRLYSRPGLGLPARAADTAPDGTLP